MNKSIIITGPRQSGKSQKAKELAEDIISKEGGHAAYFPPLGDQDIFKNKFVFSECNDGTKVIVVDSICVIGQIEPFLTAVTNGIKVHKKGIEPFNIFPTFIIVLVEGFHQSYFSDNSFGGRFDVVQCNAIHIEKSLYPAGYLEGFSMEQLNAMLRNLKENIANTAVGTSEYRQMVKQLTEIEAHVSGRFDGLIMAVETMKVDESSLVELVEESGFREENIFRIHAD